MHRKPTGLEIAVIGMAGRFPQANNIDEFWQNLLEGKECITQEFDAQEHQSSAKTIKAKGKLQKHDEFDASFFGYTPKEASMMDPQLRVFHECTWEALENAGYNPHDYEGLIGNYVGASANPTATLSPILKSSQNDNERWTHLLYSDKDFLSTRISYKLNLRGPSVTVDTACSTSLVAVDLAIQGLLTGKCDIALAGGVSITYHDNDGYIYQDGMINSPDGHCRAFDEEAMGTVSGNGVGIVVLKRLEDAIADNDAICAVILGSATNNDGSRKVGFTAPSVEGQRDVIVAAHQMAEISANDISYIEAHGTGTILGDPIEIEALSQAFQSDAKGFCALGSVKTNIGHLDAAAGIAGLIKTINILMHRKIPASLHFKNANPSINFEDSPFYVNNQLQDWSKNEFPIKAGVSSFGIGGANAHIVLEEAPSSFSDPSRRKNQLLVLSARSKQELANQKQRLSSFLQKNKTCNLEDVAYTLATGRRHFSHRFACLVQDVETATKELINEDGRNASIAVKNRPLVFMFPGQGSQYAQMGKVLYNEEPLFKYELDHCFGLLKQHSSKDFKSILFENTNSSVINDTNNAQPILFIFEYALAKLLMSYGLNPTAFIGHSLGEYVAACLSGVFSLEDGIKMILARAELMGSAKKGAMASVAIDEVKLKSLLPYNISIAAVNSRKSCVVSGDFKAIKTFVAELKSLGFASAMLKTSHAFHSHLMNDILASFEQIVKHVKFQEPKFPFISNLTGNWANISEVTTAKYWVKHLRQTVRFADGLQTTMAESKSVLVEVGPGQTLSNLAKIEIGRTQPVFNFIKRENDALDDITFFQDKIKKFWLIGLEVNWKGYFGYSRRKKLALPTYPFNSKPFPLDTGILTDQGGGNQFQNTLRRQPKDNWFYVPSWEQKLPTCLVTSTNIENMNCLFFIEDNALSDTLLKGYYDKQINSIEVRKGSSFCQVSSTSFIVNPEVPEDFKKLFLQIKRDNQLPDHIVYGWGIQQEANYKKECKTIANSALQHLVSLVQCIGELGIIKPLQLKVITANTQCVLGDEKIDLDSASIAGAIKIIDLEYENIVCKHIDIGWPLDQGKYATPQNLIAELLSQDAELNIALRGNHRWGLNYKPIKLKSNVSRIKSNGVYVITGGTGGMGFTFARHLVEKYQAKVVLLSRSDYSTLSDAKAGFIESGENISNNSIAATSAGVNRQGRCLHFQADVSNYCRMREVFNTIIETFGTINGIIHTAAVVDYDGVIQRRSWESIENVMKPKIEGTLIIDKIIQERNLSLDFMVLCSSMGNVLHAGKYGQIGYNAANEFLDVFANFKWKQGKTFTTTINWNDWLQVGMTIDSLRKRHGNLDSEKLSEKIDDAVSPEEGVYILETVLNHTFQRVLISTMDLSAQLKEMDHLLKGDKKEKLLEKIIEHASSEANHTKPNVTSNFKAPSSNLEKELVSELEGYLGYEGIGLSDNYFELGLSSLDLINLSARFKEILKVDVPVVTLFSNPSIESLLQFIKEEPQHVVPDESHELLESASYLFDEFVN